MTRKRDQKNQWVENLLAWFMRHQRTMPWRSNPKPYHVWISEAMLQQTQVGTVIPYFERFIQKFPTVKKLAEADEQDVLKVWQGLGYYSRARNLRSAAIQIMNDYNGRLPESYEELQKLKGVGPYIAAAITSIAFGNPVPVVDGNVLRVFARFLGMHDDIAKSSTRVLIFKRLIPFIEKSKNPSSFNQGVMELGALVCTPKKPKCTDCPLSG